MEFKTSILKITVEVSIVPIYFEFHSKFTRNLILLIVLPVHDIINNNIIKCTIIHKLQLFVCMFKIIHLEC